MSDLIAPLAGTRPPAAERGLRRLADTVMMTLEAVLILTRRRLRRERAAILPSEFPFRRGQGLRLVASPRDFRPASLARARALLAGQFDLAGSTLRLAPATSPFDQPSPSRAFAAALHRFDFLPDLIGAGEAGAEEALRLFLLWRTEFARPCPFVWDREILARRTFNLACASGPMARFASDLETRRLADILQVSARHLMEPAEGRASELEALIAAAVASASLGAPQGRRLVERALKRLAFALFRETDETGALISRNPREMLERLLDLLTLDDLLSSGGRPSPAFVGQAIDGLAEAVRSLSLADGRLAGFNGGDGASPALVRAALVRVEDRVEEKTSSPPTAGACGYERISGGGLEILIDAAAPPKGPLSVDACAQPLAIEAVCGGERLIVACGWSRRTGFGEGFRLTGEGSTLQVEDASCGRPLQGLAAAALGPRLVETCDRVAFERFDLAEGQLLVAAHDGWLERFGLVHERRLYLNPDQGELRGEDRLVRVGPGLTRRTLIFRIAFHLDPLVHASLSRDSRSVMMRAASDRAWRFRSDAEFSALEPTWRFSDARLARSNKILLAGEVHREAAECVVHWKLEPVLVPARMDGKTKSSPEPSPTPIDSKGGANSPHSHTRFGSLVKAGADPDGADLFEEPQGE